MFKEIMQTDKRTSLLYDAINEVLNMLGRSEHMFDLACNSLLENADNSAEVQREDRDINASERIVRRMIFEHLTLNPQQDLPTSLSLLSIVHDIERSGDYAKSLIELSEWADLDRSSSAYAESCRTLQGAIAPLFSQVVEALRDSNTDVARGVMRQHENIKQQSSALIEQLVKDDGRSNDTVPFALAARFLRRISAHLSNVASSVVNPFDRLSGKET
jgi:phosphate transport system protein